MVNNTPAPVQPANTPPVAPQKATTSTVKKQVVPAVTPVVPAQPIQQPQPTQPDSSFIGD